MDLFINIFHVVLSILLILIIILQPAKGSDIGAAFGGGGGSSTMFGPRGPGTILSRATTVVAVLFMFTSISLAMRSVPKGGAGTALSDDAGLEGLDDIDLGLDDLDLGLDLDETTESSTTSEDVEATEADASTAEGETAGDESAAAANEVEPVEAPAEAPVAAEPNDAAEATE